MTLVSVMAIIICAFFVIVFVAFQIADKRERNVYLNGIEVESTVSRCEQYFDRDHDSRHRCYVKYVGDDGGEHEGLLNVRTSMPNGRIVRIRYIPGKYDEVVFVSQEL